MRTITIAYKEVCFQNIDEVKDDEVENDLILVGIAGIKDPLRMDVP